MGILKHSTIFICLFILTKANAQSVVISQDINIKSDFSYDVMGWNNGEVLIFRDMVFNYDIMAHNASLEPIWQKEIIFEKKKVNILGVVKDTNQFSIIYHYREKSQVVGMTRTYDPSAELIRSDTVFLLEGNNYSARLFLEISPDKKKALIIQPQKSEEFLAICVDLDSLSQDWSRNIILEKGTRKNDFQQVLVSPHGEGYLIVDKNNSWAKKKNHEIEVYRFNDQATVSASIPLHGMMTYDLMFQYSETSDRLLGAATYTNKSDNRTNGIMYFNLDRTLMDEGIYSINEFDDKLLQDIYGRDVPKKKGIKDLAVRYIKPRTDGGIVLLCELSKEYSRRPSFPSASSSGYGSRRWVDYYFEEVIVYSIHPDGSVHWNNVLHKRQYSQDDDAMYSSFFVYTVPSELRVIFNDEIRNENTVSEYILNGKGEQRRSSLMSTDYQGLKLRFREAQQISSTDIIVPSQKGGKLNVVKIHFGEGATGI